MPTKDSKNTSGGTTKDARCSWTDADDAIIVRVLKEQKEAGNQSGAGWKSQVWTGVKAALKSEELQKMEPKQRAKVRIVGLMYVSSLYLQPILTSNLANIA